jgi:hypothetical protein
MIANLDSGFRQASHALRNFITQVIRAIMDLTHNGIALVGLSIAATVLVLVARPDLRDEAEHRFLSFLLERQEARNDTSGFANEPTAIERVTAAEPSELPKAQANVAYWLARKYRVAPEPLSVLVSEAFEIGGKIKLDPTLILAVMAIESRFNPFSQSPYGAQGLMQVLTKVHSDKYEGFGGNLAAFDPVSNLRVGVQVLQDTIRRAGSVEGGLRLYVGATSVDSNDYVTKVMAEHARIRSVALGKAVPALTAHNAPAASAPPRPENAASLPTLDFGSSHPAADLSS